MRPIRPQSPRRACSNQPAQSIEGFAKIMLMLWCEQVHQGVVEAEKLYPSSVTSVEYGLPGMTALYLGDRPP